MRHSSGSKNQFDTQIYMVPGETWQWCVKSLGYLVAEGSTMTKEKAEDEMLDALEDLSLDLRVFLRGSEHIIEGYAVKIWPSDGWWLGVCPALKCNIQEKSEELALKAMRETIPEMLSALAIWGDSIPSKLVE